MSLSRKRSRGGTVIDRAYRAGGVVALTAARGLANRWWPRQSASAFKPSPPMAVSRQPTRLFNKERKFADQAHLGAVEATIALANQDPISGSLVNVPLGNGASERIGRCIYPKTITVYGNFEVDEQVQNITDFYCQLWLVEDKQTNGAGMSSADFLSSPGVSIQADAFQNLEFSDRFRLLKKMMVRFSPKTFRSGVGNDALFNMQVPFRMHVNLPSYSKAQYKGISGAVTDITTHSYHLLAIKSDGAPVLQIRYQVRARYTD